MARQQPAQVTYFETVSAAPRAQHHHRIDVRVGRRFSCTMPRRIAAAMFREA